MSSLHSVLNNARTLTNLTAYRKKDEALYGKPRVIESGPAEKAEGASLYDKREASGYYDSLFESDPDLASAQRYVDRMNDQAGTVMENLLSPEPSMDTIMAKMQSGQELSPAELEHLKKTDPDLYSKAVQIAAERRAYEEKLKNCKTKEDVQRLKLTALSGVMNRVNDISSNPNIPEDKKLEMIQHEGRRAQAFNEATAEYVRSMEYAEKPTEAERNAEDKAERIEREEAVDQETVSQNTPEKAPEAGKTEGAEETAKPPESELPGQSREADADRAPLPGEGKSVAAKAEAPEGNLKPSRVHDAHDAYRRTMALKRSED